MAGRTGAVRETSQPALPTRSQQPISTPDSGMNTPPIR